MNRKDEEGRTTLIEAIQKHHFWEPYDLDILFQLGADVKVPYNNGNTPLMNAMEFGRQEISENLAQQAANVNAIKSRGETLLNMMIHLFGEENALTRVPEHWGTLRASDIEID